MAGDRVSWERAKRRGWLDTRQCAEVIGVTSDIIRGEINAGRLKAEKIKREPLPKRTKAMPAIRIYPSDFMDYLARYYPRIHWDWDCAA